MFNGIICYAYKCTYCVFTLYGRGLNVAYYRKCIHINMLNVSRLLQRLKCLIVQSSESQLEFKPQSSSSHRYKGSSPTRMLGFAKLLPLRSWLSKSFSGPSSFCQRLDSARLTRGSRTLQPIFVLGECLVRKLSYINPRTSAKRSYECRRRESLLERKYELRRRESFVGGSEIPAQNFWR